MGGGGRETDKSKLSCFRDCTRLTKTRYLQYIHQNIPMHYVTPVSIGSIAGSIIIKLALQMYVEKFAYSKHFNRPCNDNRFTYGLCTATLPFAPTHTQTIDHHIKRIPMEQQPSINL